MKRSIFAMLAVGWAVVAAVAQQPVGTVVTFDSTGENLRDQAVDDRVGDRPVSWVDKSLRIDRELKQGDEVAQVRPPVESKDSGARVRARATVEEDRERVKREVALSE